MSRAQPTAHPWDDTDVIDQHAARFGQGTTGVVALLGLVFGWPLAWALMSAQLLIGVTFGRQWCIPCQAYYRLVQPRLGEGPLEDSRPPRLANKIGVVVLGGAAAAWWAGVEPLGYALGGLVAFLALLSASTGFCAGCELYRLTARLRGISPQHHDHIEPDDLAELNGALSEAERAYVQFTHPLCSECREWAVRLAARSEPSVIVDVRERPELAHKYGIAVVPTVVAIAPDGEVLERLAP